MKLPCVGLVWVLGWVPLVAQQGNPESVAEERLRAAFAEAIAACHQVLGVAREDLPPLRCVDAAELARVVAAENLPLVRLRQRNDTKARAEADQLGKGVSSTAYAKYAWSSRTVLVEPHTWARTAASLQRPDLTSDAALRAVLVHELCHAIDDRKFDIGKRVLEAKTADAAKAFSAVFEGHAQLVTRRVCKVRGWSDGFDAFTGAIGAVPSAESRGPVEGFLLRLAAEANKLIYIDGERFVAAVVAARPATGAHDLFLSPPKNLDLIDDPQRYLAKTAPSAPGVPPTAESPSPTRDTLGCYVMLGFPRIRTELQITAAQGQQLDVLLAQMEGAEALPVLALLTDEQIEGFHRLSAHCFGPWVVCDPAWAKRLAVAPAQQAEVLAAVTKALEGLRPGSKAGCAPLRAVRRALGDAATGAPALRDIGRALQAQLGGPCDPSLFEGSQRP